MTLKLILSVLILAAVCTASEQNRIVGGNDTTIEEYPTIVQVEFRSLLIWSQSCAASVLNSLYVLSAAHCFAGIFFDVNSRRIRAGTTNRNSGGVIVYVEAAINHPSYSSITLDGDISVVRLADRLTFSNVIQPVAIVIQSFELPDNLPVVHAGWGATSQGGSASPILQDVEIFTVNRQLCHERYQTLFPRRSVTENMICAGILDVGGRDACQGDSGGPLYYQNILVGIVSWGQGCAQAFYPGVSTNVASYTNWIISTAV
ncbi:trypsin, alkaline C-like isoform X2 [Galleria mellonella]|uniref:Trypsin, alkaline C-like isoform X2 n=1 Tax=Galleria mellonella TaxID=7137 RepID=A0ABM3MRI4_GALME|nr:trypsin, alkaline C-like isoform X2 [Galleria mellonella]